MTYSVYLDFDNLWIPHQRTALPSLENGEDGAARALEPSVRAQLHTLLGRLPSVVMAAVKDHCGPVHRVAYAYADWHTLHHSSATRLYDILTDLNVQRVDRVTLDLNSSHRDYKKNAADFELLAHAVTDMGWGSARDDDTIVIGSSDHGLARFARRYLTISAKHRFVFVHFASATSDLLLDLARKYPGQIVCVPIEDYPAYKELYGKCYVADPRHAQRSATPLMTKVRFTTIQRLWFAREKSERPYSPKVHLFCNWITDWHQYWYERGTVATPPSVAETQEILSYLMNMKIITFEVEQGKQIVRLVESVENEVALLELRANERHFETKYDLPNKPVVRKNRSA